MHLQLKETSRNASLMRESERGVVGTPNLVVQFRETEVKIYAFVGCSIGADLNLHITMYDLHKSLVRIIVCHPLVLSVPAFLVWRRRTRTQERTKAIISPLG